MTDTKERRVWYFTCTRCHKNRRMSMKKRKAVDGLCARCRRNKPDENQVPLPGIVEGGNNG